MAPRSIKSAERTLRLFELFSRRQDALTVSEVARGLEIPQPSASMLLTNLTAMGYLNYQGATRSYAPTVRVALLGGWVGPQFSGPRSLATWLDDLHARVGEDVYVGIQNDAAAQIVQVRGDNALSIDSGQMYSLTCSVIGMALLATKPDSQVVKLVRRCNAEAARDEDRVNEADYMALIAEVRRSGYAINRGYFAEGRTGIGMAILSPRDGGFAVGFGGPTERIDAKLALILEQLRALRDAAEDTEPGWAEFCAGTRRFA